ncbi:MAG: hypothetical protein KGK44_11410 [Gammaproteobacteria bacterium]|nr:hypothetical protein [Gammaproteobacteria bacterium]
MCIYQSPDLPYLSKASLLIVLLMATLAGCDPKVSALKPQILTFNYSIQTVADASALIDSVRNGKTTIARLIARSPCNFIAGFTGQTPPQMFPNGTPGQAGFNVQIMVSAPDNVSTTNPSSCEVPDEIEINIGSHSQVLALGMPTSLAGGRLWFTNGSKYQNSEFFRATVQGFDATISRTKGDFAFIDRLAPGSNTLLMVEGSFAMTP